MGLRGELGSSSGVARPFVDIRGDVIGGVGGISPVTLTRLSIARHSSFNASKGVSWLYCTLSTS